MNGQLSEQPLAELIREIETTGVSGALRLARERVQAVVYAQAGAILYARTNLRAHRLTEALRRWGRLNAEQVAVASDAGTEAEASAALVRAGLIKPEEWPHLRTRLATDVLRPLLLWTDGFWNFDPRARLAEEVAGQIETAELLLEGARRLPAEFAAARLTDGDTLAPAAAPPVELSLLPVEAFILSRVDAPLKLSELVAVSGLPERETRHTVYALALAGLITRNNWPRIFDANTIAQARVVAKAATQGAGAQVQAAPAAVQVEAKSEQPASPVVAAEADPQAEIAALLARGRGADHYQLLGVGRTANAREIKRAYYALAKRFHPDRFRRDVAAAELTRIEAAFAQIAQAYETLTDERARANYDSKLAGATAASTAAPTAQAQTSGANTNVQTQTQSDAESHFQRGLAALKQNHVKQAVAYFAEAVRLAPRQSRYHAHYGQALAHDPQTRRQAETELHAALALDPANATHRVMLAELYFTLAHMRRAEAELKRALVVEPHHAGARQLLDKLKAVTDNN
jgi:cytochrome c-type biogenesis protein CcmH/NrfG